MEKKTEKKENDFTIRFLNYCVEAIKYNKSSKFTKYEKNIHQRLYLNVRKTGYKFSPGNMNDWKRMEKGYYSMKSLTDKINSSPLLNTWKNPLKAQTIKIGKKNFSGILISRRLIDSYIKLLEEKN